jgi:hypothetical protein
VIFRRRPDEPEAERDPSEAEEQAETLADLAPLDEEAERDALKEIVAKTRADIDAAGELQGEDAELATLSKAVKPLAEALDKPKAEVAEILAEASSLSRAYQHFLEAHELYPMPDRQRLLEDEREALKRKIERAEAKLTRGNLTTSRRRRIEEDLEHTRELEARTFAELNPASPGSVWDGPESGAPEKRYCRCRREIPDRDRAFRIGYCERCEHEANLAGVRLPRV